MLVRREALLCEWRRGERFSEVTRTVQENVDTTSEILVNQRPWVLERSLGEFEVHSDEFSLAIRWRAL